MAEQQVSSEMNTLSLSETMISLITSDNVVFKVKPSIAKEMAIVQSFLDESDGKITTVPLHNVSSSELPFIIEYCEKNVAEEINKVFEAEFAKNLNNEELKDLFLAGNYLDMNDKGKKLEASLAKISKENEETLMGAYMHEIVNEGKSIEEFDHDVKNRLLAFTLDKIKIIRKRTRHFENKILPVNNPAPPLTPISYTSENIDDIIGSNTWILPYANLNGNVDSLPPQETFEDQENFGGFDDNIGSSMSITHRNSSGGDTLLPQENFGDQFNFENFDDNIGSNMLIPPHTNSDVTDVDVLSHQENFGVQGNFGDFDDNTCNNM